MYCKWLVMSSSEGHRDNLYVNYIIGGQKRKEAKLHHARERGGETSQGRDEKRCGASVVLKIKITACCNELVHDDLIGCTSRDMKGRHPILVRKIGVASRCNELLGDEQMPFPILVERRFSALRHSEKSGG